MNSDVSESYIDEIFTLDNNDKIQIFKKNNTNTSDTSIKKVILIITRS